MLAISVRQSVVRKLMCIAALVILTEVARVRSLACTYRAVRRAALEVRAPVRVYCARTNSVSLGAEEGLWVMMFS